MKKLTTADLGSRFGEILALANENCSERGTTKNGWILTQTKTRADEAKQSIVRERKQQRRVGKKDMPGIARLGDRMNGGTL